MFPGGLSDSARDISQPELVAQVAVSRQLALRLLSGWVGNGGVRLGWRGTPVPCVRSASGWAVFAVEGVFGGVYSITTGAVHEGGVMKPPKDEFLSLVKLGMQ